MHTDCLHCFSSTWESTAYSYTCALCLLCIFFFFFFLLSLHRNRWIPYSLLMHEGQLFTSHPCGERKTGTARRVESFIECVTAKYKEENIGINTEDLTSECKETKRRWKTRMAAFWHLSWGSTQIFQGHFNVTLLNSLAAMTATQWTSPMISRVIPICSISNWCLAHSSSGCKGVRWHQTCKVWCSKCRHFIVSEHSHWSKRLSPKLCSFPLGWGKLTKRRLWVLKRVVTSLNYTFVWVVGHKKWYSSKGRTDGDSLRTGGFMEGLRLCRGSEWVIKWLLLFRDFFMPQPHKAKKYVGSSGKSHPLQKSPQE